jgi:CarD family transcriptional regulator
MRKYQINDTVFYGTNGVCRISAIEQLSFSDDPDDYYILRPVYNAASTIYVPLGNPTLCGRMRPLITEDRLTELFRRMTDEVPDWIEDNNRRRAVYSEILQTAEPEEVLAVLRTLRSRSETLRMKKKRLHISDEKLFHDAERMLHEEIAYVAGIRMDEVNSYIAREVGRIAH